jgi:hypothetical protein
VTALPAKFITLQARSSSDLLHAAAGKRFAKSTSPKLPLPIFLS